MTFSNECPSSTYGGKQKHRMSVTHSSPGLHGQGNPLSGTVVENASSRVGYLEYASSMGSTAISGPKETFRAPERPQNGGKGLSMRTQVECPLSQRLRKGPSAVPVKAEKGSHAYQLERRSSA
jgi:hypothetical protein